MWKEWDSESIIFPMKYQFENEFYLEDNTSNSYGTTYTFTLISNLGNAKGTITFPEMAMFTYPSQNDTLPIDNITITWTDCKGADYYDLNKQIYARDSTGNIIQMQYSDTSLTSTTITIPSSEFDVVGATYYVVSLFVRPKAGVLSGTGESSNMTGSILGYIFAGGDGDIMSFYVGTPSGAIQFPNTNFSLGTALSTSSRLMENMSGKRRR